MYETYKSILVGIEFRTLKATTGFVPTTDSEAAVLRAIDVARAHESKLMLAHVFDVDPLAREWMEKAGNGPGTYLGEARVALDRLQDTTKAASIACSHRLLFGKPAEELARIAVDGGHDLLVVGARRSESTFRRALFGSTANRLLRVCTLPIWIVRPAPRPFARVLVATDLSELGERVLAHALRLALLDDADVHVVHAVDQWLAGRSYLLGPLATGFERQLAQVVGEARAKLERQVAAACSAIRFAREPKIHLEAMLPEELILRVARVENVDMVAIGTAARQGLGRFLLGNTCERILPEVSCALLAVH